jgi:hypothetical protein
MSMRKYGPLSLLFAGVLSLSACLGDTGPGDLPQDDGAAPSPAEAAPNELDPSVALSTLSNNPDAPQGEAAQGEEVSAFELLPRLCGTAYSDSNMQGIQYELYSDQESFANSNISSFVVGPSCTVTLTDRNGIKQNFPASGGGTFYTYVGDSWNDRATRISCSCSEQRLVAALYYEDASFSGNYIPVWNDVNGTMPTGWNDRVSSVKTNTGSSSLMTEHSGSSGAAYVSQGTSSSNIGSSMNDKASYFRTAGTYWPGCAPVSRCFTQTYNCGGISVVSPDLLDCFRNRAGLSYCQPANNSSSVCIPTFF